MTTRELNVFRLLENAIEKIDCGGEEDKEGNFNWELSSKNIGKILNHLLEAKDLLLK